MNKKGLFFSFEGIDGSGKSYNCDLFEDWFKKEYPEITILKIREPGGTEISEKIRNIILDQKNEMSDLTELLLYAASRAELTAKKIKPALAKGHLVISDRFVYSSFAYQGYARELGFKKVYQINEIATAKIFPDWNIFLNLKPHEALLRNQTKKLDRIEKVGIKFQEEVYRGYQEIMSNSKENKFIDIDANQSKSVVFNEIKKAFLLKWNEHYGNKISS